MIRSYQNVGRDVSETRLYSFGKRPDGTPLRLPVPIPLMGLVWAFAAFVVLLIIGRVLGVAQLPHHRASAGAYGPVVLWHVGLPILIAYVLTIAEVEGRRVHTVLRAMVMQGPTRRWVGGYRPAGGGGERFAYRRIRVRFRA